MDNQSIVEFIQGNKKKDIEELPILGDMVTGQTKNFVDLEKQNLLDNRKKYIAVQVNLR